MVCWHQCYPLERAFDHKLSDKDPENARYPQGIYQDPSRFSRVMWLRWVNGLTVTMNHLSIHTSHSASTAVKIERCKPKSGMTGRPCDCFKIDLMQRTQL